MIADFRSVALVAAHDDSCFRQAPPLKCCNSIVGQGKLYFIDPENRCNPEDAPTLKHLQSLLWPDGVPHRQRDFSSRNDDRTSAVARLHRCRPEAENWGSELLFALELRWPPVRPILKGDIPVWSQRFPSTAVGGRKQRQINTERKTR